MSEFKMKPFFPPEISAQWDCFAKRLREHLVKSGKAERYADFLRLVETFEDAMADPEKRGQVNDTFYGIFRVTTDSLNLDYDSEVMEPFAIVMEWFNHR